MLKRIWLIILMNAAILIIANLFLYILSLFWVNVNYASYGWLFIFCLVASFVGSTISLFISKWLAKTTYWVRVVTQADYNSLSEKEKLVFDVVKDLSERNHMMNQMHLQLEQQKIVHLSLFLQDFWILWVKKQ